VRHFASRRSWEYLNSLPRDVQTLARSNFALLKANPGHPSLHFKPVLYGRLRSVRVGLHYRALGVAVPEGVQWFWIGSHAEYDRWLNK
jgi:hypothetical protein